MRESKSREEGEIGSEKEGEGRFTPLFLPPLNIVLKALG